MTRDIRYYSKGIAKEASRILQSKSKDFKRRIKEEFYGSLGHDWYHFLFSKKKE